MRRVKGTSYPEYVNGPAQPPQNEKTIGLCSLDSVRIIEKPAKFSNLLAEYFSNFGFGLIRISNKILQFLYN